MTNDSYEPVLGSDSKHTELYPKAKMSQSKLLLEFDSFKRIKTTLNEQRSFPKQKTLTIQFF